MNLSYGIIFILVCPAILSQKQSLAVYVPENFPYKSPWYKLYNACYNIALLPILFEILYVQEVATHFI